MNALKKAHLIIGIISLLAFLFSGAYMKLNIANIEESDHLRRMMFRANHLYILLVALLNLVTSYSFHKSQVFIKLSYLSTALIVLSTIVLNCTFYIEPISGDIEERSYTALALEVLLVGVLLHVLILRFVNKKSAAH